MTLLQRLSIFLGFCLALAAFWLLPDELGFDANARLVWAAVAQLGGPLLAAICCWVAASRTPEGDRPAWRNFAIGAAIYFLGNLAYLVEALLDAVPAFPSLNEAAYFVMAGFFAAGMLRYSQLRHRFGSIQIYNFALIGCAVALSSLFLLNGSISASVMAVSGTIVAFLYPVLWFSVAAFGLVSLTLYGNRRNAFAFTLLVLAILLEAIADFRYALALMDGTYQLGSGITSLLWVASAGLLVWAALERMATAKLGVPLVGLSQRRTDRRVVQAAIPAIAVGAIILSGSLSGLVSGGAFAWLGAILAIAFALVAGFREHWIIVLQRQLRQNVETSRGELADSQKRLAEVLESTSDSVLVLNRDWNVVYFNHHAAETINQRNLLRVGISVWELFPAAATSGEGDHYRRAIATGQSEDFEIFVNDRQIWLRIQAYPTPDGLSIFFHDISLEKLARDEVEHLALHDPLTSLANRVLFQRELASATGSGAPVAVLLLDLDHFKEVNDTLGHPVGDALLVGTAARLRQCLGETTTVGRLGGDEFAAILVGHEGADEVGVIAQKLIDAANAPHLIDGQSVRVGASIGVALSDGLTASPPDELFKNADIALYAAKSEARGGFRFFEMAMQIELLQKQALRADLAGALDRGEFSLAFQPLVDLKRDRVAGFEALLRWTHPQRGAVGPDLFVPVAEETGQIVAIGEWVLRTACAEAMTWPDHISVAVNLSSRQFSAGDLPKLVQDVLAETGLPASRLELEITETVLLRDSQANMQMLRQLRDLGVRIALDDFGTGFSSLVYLQRFPFSKIKIDRTFISALPDNDESLAIVRSVIGLGQSLGLRVTAEGVETQAQLDLVRAGCDEAQGYYLSQPVPADLVPGVIARLERAPQQRRAG